MKIIMLPYNRDVSAIMQANTMAAESRGESRLAANRFIASGYEDRLLWEEASALREKKNSDYVIPGIWQ